MFGSAAGHRWTFLASGATLISGRGTQVVRERSAKPLCVGSIPTRASSVLLYFTVLPGLNNKLLDRARWGSTGRNRRI